jgi:hypothetical protein
VLVAQLRADLGLPTKPRARVLALGVRCVEELQRNGLPQVEVHGRDDHAHAASPDHALEPVLSVDDDARLELVEKIALLVPHENPRPARRDVVDASIFGSRESRNNLLILRSEEVPPSAPCRRSTGPLRGRRYGARPLRQRRPAAARALATSS